MNKSLSKSELLARLVEIELDAMVRIIDIKRDKDKEKKYWLDYNVNKRLRLLACTKLRYKVPDFKPINAVLASIEQIVQGSTAAFNSSPSLRDIYIESTCELLKEKEVTTIKGLEEYFYIDRDFFYKTINHLENDRVIYRKCETYDGRYFISYLNHLDKNGNGTHRLYSQERNSFQYDEFWGRMPYETALSLVLYDLYGSQINLSRQKRVREYFKLYVEGKYNVTP